MKYRHDFHAGNFADVHKHVVLLALLRALQRKSKGFLYLDTHAGSGRYDLTSAAAHHGAEAAHGIHLLARTTPRTEALRHYLDTIAGWRQRCGNPRAYPGSPLLAAAQLRAQDRGICCELQHSAFRMLERTLADQPQLRAECADGYVQLRALLPAVERRALALIDPPYEDSAQEFNHAADAIDAAFDAVARLQRPDAFGRAGEDQVAGLQFDQRRQRMHDLRDAPDHVVDIAGLAQLAVDPQFDPAAFDYAGIG